MLDYLKITNKCIGCDNCRIFCPEDAIVVSNKKYTIDTWSCTLCEICIMVCPVDCIKGQKEEIKADDN